LILAKLLETLKPDRVLIWDTEYAKANDIDRKALRIIESFFTYRGLDKANIESKFGDQFKNPIDVHQMISNYLQDLGKYRVYIDVTGGSSLNAAFLTSIALSLIQRGKDVSTCYCDYKSQSIYIFRPDTMLLETKDIKLDFFLSSLEKRLLINDVHTDINYTTMYQSGKVSRNEVEIKLFDLLLNQMDNFTFRNLFLSYFELLRDWLKRTKLSDYTEPKDWDYLCQETIHNTITLNINTENIDGIDKVTKDIYSYICDSLNTNELEYELLYDSMK
jgi:hypothetical protein